jgi:hypothetical protein
VLRVKCCAFRLRFGVGLLLSQNALLSMRHCRLEGGWQPFSSGLKSIEPFSLEPVWALDMVCPQAAWEGLIRVLIASFTFLA